MGEVCMIMRQHSHQFSFNNTKTFGSGFRFSVIYRRVCFILVVTQHNQFRLQHLEIGKKKKSLLGYVLLTHSNARTQRLSSLQIWKDRGWGWDEEGKSDLFFIAELGRCLSKNGLGDEFMCVGTWVCLSFGRERKKISPVWRQTSTEGPSIPAVWLVLTTQMLTDTRLSFPRSDPTAGMENKE